MRLNLNSSIASLQFQVKSCFSECDLNCDGKITEAEFYKAGKGVAEMFELEGDD